MADRSRLASYGEHGQVTVDDLNGGDGVFIVTMDNPEEFNVLSGDFMFAIAQAFDGITALRHPDPNKDRVRAVILRAQGRAFTVGLDIGRLNEYLEGGLTPDRDPFRAMWACPFPIIGSVNGPAVTGGFEIALCCDVLLASRGAVFIDNHAKYGVHPGRRVSQRLAEVCGMNNAKLASMAAYPIDADIAFNWGLVQRVFSTTEELDAESIAIARLMSNNHPVMVKRYKDILERGALDSYRAGIALEESSEATYYDDLSNVAETLADGAKKFRDMVQWVATRD
ncbi:MAG: enoyl-CoA hydratase [Gammaproteobacteria bacterium]|jgi:enoyl-CoA hydratase